MFELVLRSLDVCIFTILLGWPKKKERGAHKMQISCAVFARGILKNKMHLQTHTHAHINYIYSGPVGGNFGKRTLTPTHTWPFSHEACHL